VSLTYWSSWAWAGSTCCIHCSTTQHWGGRYLGGWIWTTGWAQMGGRESKKTKLVLNYWMYKQYIQDFSIFPVL